MRQSNEGDERTVIADGRGSWTIREARARVERRCGLTASGEPKRLFGLQAILAQHHGDSPASA